VEVVEVVEAVEAGGAVGVEPGAVLLLLRPNEPGGEPRSGLSAAPAGVAGPAGRDGAAAASPEGAGRLCGWSAACG
ncbi:MAG: hypothetical protein ACRDOE_05655, partial [Streptosporangiaceae bacterium]